MTHVRPNSLFHGDAFDDAKSGNLADVISWGGHVEGSLTILVDPIPLINAYGWIVGPESIEKVFSNLPSFSGRMIWQRLSRCPVHPYSSICLEIVPRLTWKMQPDSLTEHKCMMRHLEKQPGDSATF
jgi:hypothetical protein